MDAEPIPEPILIEVVEEPPSRPWLTILLSLGVLAAFIVTQQVVAGIFLAAAMKRDATLDVDAWIEEIQFNGKFLAVCTVVTASISMPLILAAARKVSPGAAGELLGLRVPSVKQTTLWLAALAAFIVISDGTSWLLGRDIVPPFMRQAYLTAGFPPLLWFALVVAAPLGEELLYRGLLYGGLWRSAIGPVGAAVLSSLGFAALHIQYDLHDMTTVFLIGLLLAAARYATGSVILCILLHGVMNLVATVQAAVAIGD